ncbi:MAG: biotin/lipoyl-binding protein, partial [Pseudomonadales bacterium]|nr:biotin/lipoyl-binding protein [Pseudomonadales bacterium]
LQFQIAENIKLNTEQILESTQPPPEGYAIQLRINGESLLKDGSLLPAFGDITRFDVSMARGTRLDTHIYNGYAMSANYDSLLAKLIVKSIYPSFSKAIKTSYRNLCSISIDGVDTNVEILKNILMHPIVDQQDFYTRFIDEHISDLITDSQHPQLFMCDAPSNKVVEAKDLGSVPDNAITSPLHGTVVSIEVSRNQTVAKGTVLIILEAMKMEHVITAPTDGLIQQILVTEGNTVTSGQALLLFECQSEDASDIDATTEMDIETIRPDLQELIQRHDLLLDDARPEAIAKRHLQGYRSARENVADLCDGSEFIEYGGLVIAGQRQRKSLEQLIEQTPADGMVAGIGHINESQFGRQRSQCILMSYDYTVMAGTQGLQNHRKKDRMFELAERKQLPVILLAEGGGGRPGDTDALSPAWLDCLAFYLFAKLADQVPLIGLVNGRCFAGNAALFGCCDITIATETANIGMGGPAMIEGGGLGKYAPEEVGPIDDQRSNGVVDIVVKDEPQGVAVCKQILSYFQGSIATWECADQRLLRQAVPENRRRVYDIYHLITVLADKESFLEIQADYGKGIITGFARIEGNAVAVVANNPNYLSGAIESTVATKAAKFLTLCDKYQIPVTFLCDTPGFMVGPDIEKTGLVRHAANLFIQGAKLSVPFATVVLRKCYGLGAMAMAGGHLKAPLLTVSWPTGEFGAMGLEGAVRLGYRRELEAIEDDETREQAFQRMVDEAYAQGKATHMATYFEFDHVIDPADTRDWIKEVLF